MKKPNYFSLSFFLTAKINLCLVGIFIFSFCSAQQNNGLTALNQKIDSLQKVLQKAKHDTTRASVYLTLSEELYLSDIDTVLPLCFKAIQIADAGLNGANASENNLSYYPKPVL